MRRKTPTKRAKKELDHDFIDAKNSYLRLVEDYIHFMGNISLKDLTEVFVLHDKTISWERSAALSVMRTILYQIRKDRPKAIVMDKQEGLRTIFISKFPGIITEKPVVKFIRISTDLT